MKNLNETLAALRLGQSHSWHHIFIDGISCWQIAIQNLVIVVIENGKLDPIIVSSYMVFKSETSKSQVESIVDSKCQQRNVELIGFLSVIND